MRWTAAICSAMLVAMSLSAPPAYGQQVEEVAPASDFEDTILEGDVAAYDELLKRLTATEEKLAEMEAAQEAERKAAADAKKKDEAEKKPAEEKPKEWYERIRLRGYAQIRINEVVSREFGSAPAMHNGDASFGEDEGFIVRRARMIFSGDVSDYVSIYLQPDFASNVPGSPDSNHFVQIRDWYADLHLDKEKEFRFRVGQSKIPYGWENMQSSSNRLPLDRNDAFNSAARNERDLGVFFYWTPEYAQDFFKKAVDDGLKGSGNYGVFGLGVYNGQGGSFQEQNDDLHLIARLAVPYTFEDGQMMEWGIQGYTGEYTVLSSAISPLGVGPAVRPTGALETGGVGGVRDERLGVTWVWYPQPLGFQSEWTVGRGPALNETQTLITDRALYGGYVMSMYRHESRCYGEFIPFTRWSYYQGGYKSERNAPFSEIDELEFGLEWQFNKNVELVTMYTFTDRTNTRAISTANTLSYTQFEGEGLRFQLQFNY